MYKIENKYIDFRKNRTKNRILDNYLDWVIYSMLPASIGNALFPDFNDLLGNQPQSEYPDYTFLFAYVEMVNTQTITDSSTEMAYDVKSIPLSLSNVVDTLGTAKRTIEATYPFDWSLFTDGQQFTGLGFGRNDYNSDGDFYVNNYLMSFVNLSLTEESYDTDSDFAISRSAEISTNETSISVGYGFLPESEAPGKLQTIAMCFAANGGGASVEYNLPELSFAYVSAGKVAVTGFHDFYISDSIWFPSEDLYPRITRYPTQEGYQVRSVRFKYIDDLGNVYITYVNIEDLDTSYNSTEVSINLVCERG